MNRFKETFCTLDSDISIEFVSDHEKLHTHIIHRHLPYRDNFSDDLLSLLRDEKISLDDVVSISLFWTKRFINPTYHGQSFKIVGED